jgi:S-adenosylmethionine hydrolase
MPKPVITLTTDFGQADAYVGIMKGVMLGICPGGALVDISHEIHPQAVRQAAYVLSTATAYFPEGTIHLVVVDPGVGSERQPIAVQTARASYVAPDNGVLGMALAQDPPRKAVRIRVAGSHFVRREISDTFHGRDIFAPVAAHLACGAALDEIGDDIPVDGLVALPGIEPRVDDASGDWVGEVLHIDRFGNLVTSIRYPTDRYPLPNANLSLKVGQVRIVGLSRTFSDVARGEVVAYVGSSGYLEIAEREGNAARRLAVGVGDPIRVRGLS